MILDKNSIFGVTAGILYNAIAIAKESRKDCSKIKNIHDIYEYAISLQFGRQVGLTTAMCSWINDNIPIDASFKVLYIVNHHSMAGIIHSKLTVYALQQTLVISPKDISRIQGHKFDYVICDTASTTDNALIDEIVYTVYKPNTVLIQLG